MLKSGWKSSESWPYFAIISAGIGYFVMGGESKLIDDPMLLVTELINSGNVDQIKDVIATVTEAKESGNGNIGILVALAATFLNGAKRTFLKNQEMKIEKIEKNEKSINMAGEQISINDPVVDIK